MVTRTAQLSLFVSAALVASGCFDVHTVDPGPFVFDDFDDGSFQPADHYFRPWDCFAYNPTKTSGFSCDHDTGFASPYSLYLQATIDDPLDGVQEFGGAQLVTIREVPEDLSGFKELSFAAKLESGVPPLPSAALLYVELPCASATTTEGAQPGDLFVNRAVNYQSYWQVTTVSLADFVEPSYQATRIQGGVAGCIQRVDALRFSINAGLADGQSASFTLHVDDIRLQ